MEEKQRFKTGDIVTYKRPENCFGGRYRYGGVAPLDPIQKILSYLHYEPSRKCWKISVRHSDGGSYNMLEDEFEEYDQIPKEVSNYSIF